MIGNNQISTTVSIGVVPYRSDIAGTDAMMMKADLALYRAKSRRPQPIPLPRGRARRRGARTHGDRRRFAACGRAQRARAVHQPQVELESGMLVGLEALLRSNHPTRGLLLPASFIPIAETNGSIVPIGEWVIARACRQIKDWNRSGLAPPQVAVNLSGAQFKLASQLDRIVIENLERCRIPSGQLELELTESVLIETAERHSAVS